jgi:seryl-tRNA synthetase
MCVLCSATLQSRRLDVRLRMPKTPEGEAQKEYVHMLNGTLTATERTMCCLLENHQTPEGVK